MADTRKKFDLSLREENVWERECSHINGAADIRYECKEGVITISNVNGKTQIIVYRPLAAFLKEWIADKGNADSFSSVHAVGIGFTENKEKLQEFINVLCMHDQSIAGIKNDILIDLGLRESEEKIIQDKEMQLLLEQLENKSETSYQQLLFDFLGLDLSSEQINMLEREQIQDLLDQLQQAQIQKAIEKAVAMQESEYFNFIFELAEWLEKNSLMNPAKQATAIRVYAAITENNPHFSEANHKLFILNIKNISTCAEKDKIAYLIKQLKFAFLSRYQDYIDQAFHQLCGYSGVTPFQRNVSGNLEFLLNIGQHIREQNSIILNQKKEIEKPNNTTTMNVASKANSSSGAIVSSQSVFNKQEENIISSFGAEKKY